MAAAEAQELDRQIDGIAEAARAAQKRAAGMCQRVTAEDTVHQINLLIHGANRITDKVGSSLDGGTFTFERPEGPKYHSKSEPIEPGDEPSAHFLATLFNAGFGQDPDRFGVTMLITSDGSTATVKWTGAAAELNAVSGKTRRQPVDVFVSWLQKHRLVYRDTSRTPDRQYGGR